MNTHERKYLCPSCKIPILVGEHSITIDRERIKEAAFENVLLAARDICINTREDYKPKIERLRLAILELEQCGEGG